MCVCAWQSCVWTGTKCPLPALTIGFLASVFSVLWSVVWILGGCAGAEGRSAPRSSPLLGSVFWGVWVLGVLWVLRALPITRLGFSILCSLSRTQNTEPRKPLGSARLCPSARLRARPLTLPLLAALMSTSPAPPAAALVRPPNLTHSATTRIGAAPKPHTQRHHPPAPPAATLMWFPSLTYNGLAALAGAVVGVGGSFGEPLSRPPSPLAGVRLHVHLLRVCMCLCVVCVCVCVCARACVCVCFCVLYTCMRTYVCMCVRALACVCALKRASLGRCSVPVRPRTKKQRQE